MMIDFLELTKISLNTGDVLIVKLLGDEYTSDDIQSLKASFDVVFPNNKVMVTTLPEGYDMTFEAIAQAPKPSLCVDPVSFCSDCECGKKDSFNSSNNQENT